MEMQISEESIREHSILSLLCYVYTEVPCVSLVILSSYE